MNLPHSNSLTKTAGAIHERREATTHPTGLSGKAMLQPEEGEGSTTGRTHLQRG